MKIIFLFILFFSTNVLSAQLKNSKEKLRVSHDIKHNALRASLTLPILISQDPAIIAINYEHRLGKSPFSIIGTLGTSIYFFGSGLNRIGDKIKWHLHGLFSSELRYYYTLKKRERLDKNTKNFTAGYLSLQPYYLTDPYLLIDERKEFSSGNQGVFLNIGYQWQAGRGYIGTFFGVRLAGTYFNAATYQTKIQTGIVIGGFLK